MYRLNDALQDANNKKAEQSEAMLDFEKQCMNIKHNHCICCRMVGINLKINKNSICEKCAKLKNPNYYLEKRQLPVWRKDGVPIYTVPKELESLSHAEKMLIQRVSPFVPLHHIKQGVMGLTGHVCAFEQDIGELVQKLPRMPSDVSILRVFKTVNAEIGNSKSSHMKAFRVNKSKVLAALRFLKCYNSEYRDIEIDESRLDWIDGDEGILRSKEMETEEEILTNQDDTAQNADIGPCPRQAFDPKASGGDDVDVYGYVETGGVAHLSKNDHTINEKLQKAVRDRPKEKRSIYGLAINQRKSSLRVQ